MALVSSDNKYGYIDTKGNVVIPISYELTGELGFGSFHDGLAPIVKNGKYGYIDKNGKEVISCKYDESYSFSEGLAVIAKDDKYGFIDTKGNEVVPCEFDYADSFIDGKASVRKGEKVMVIDKSGKVVFTASDGNSYTFIDGLARVTKEINGDYLTGFIDINGKEVIPCIYSSWYDFSEGLVAVSKDGINGYVDKDGKSTFDYLSEDIVAKFKEKQRIEKQKQEEEQRKREEENKPTNRFFNLASDYMWESEGYGYDFGSGERTQLLFYPSNKGGGRITYQNLSTDYSSIFRGYSATSTYQVSDGFISCTIIGDKSEIPWELNLNFAIENIGNSVRLVRLLDKPVQRWSNRQGKIVTYDKIFYSPKPKGNDYTK